MASSGSSSDKQNQELTAFCGTEPVGKRRKVSESSRLYDVFINHRGPDVKETLATQLYNSLKERDIQAFLDSEEKELGNSFPSTIETAIRSAKVHIAIFSKRYAESPWCLAELLLMWETEAKIIPVFFQVEPWELRRVETGVYAEAFLKHKEKGRYLDKLNTWKKALHRLSFIAGHKFNGDGDCQEIVDAVQKEVQRKSCLFVAEHPVGLNNLVEDFEKRSLDGLVEDIENKCELKNREDKVKMVGIFGMGGLGKTTLAKELFNRKKSNYINSSLLFDAREADLTSQLPRLQHKLLQDLFCNNDLSFRNKEEGTSHLKNCLERSPVLDFLIVIDDIDHVKQLNALLVMDLFKKSSNCLVIVTTRDEGVLISAGISNRYHLEGMDRNHGTELFCWHAFDQSCPSTGYEELVDSFVTACGGLPLSLQVLGRHVRGRSDCYWRSELMKVSKMLHRDVKERLRISFDSLDNEEKQVFMDVACFFVGKTRAVADRILEGSGWNAHNAIETLEDKCLLQKNDFSNGGPVLRMHDHLRDLGREMALELSPPHRLWRPQDLKSLESVGFQRMLTETDVRCFHSIYDESMSFHLTFFLGPSNNRFEKSGSLLWLELKGNSSRIDLQKLQYSPNFGRLDFQVHSCWPSKSNSCYK